MFDFEKFPVTLETKRFLNKINPILKINFNSNLKNQLARASSSILLNITEGAGRYTDKDKRSFYIIAKASAYECISIIFILKEYKTIDEKTYKNLYNNLYLISKMLTGLIKKFTN